MSSCSLCYTELRVLRAAAMRRAACVGSRVRAWAGARHTGGNARDRRARAGPVVVEDDTVSDHFAILPVPHLVVRQEDVPGYLETQPGDAMMQP